MLMMKKDVLVGGGFELTCSP